VLVGLWDGRYGVDCKIGSPIGTAEPQTRVCSKGNAPAGRVEAKSSASTSDNSNFALEAKYAAEVLQLDVNLGGHHEGRIEDLRGWIEDVWAAVRYRAGYSGSELFER
jgi:hypothetical protein